MGNADLANKPVSLASLNAELAKRSRNFYPQDERAGFNFGKSICNLVESLGVNELHFINGILKPLCSRQKLLSSIIDKEVNV